MEQGYSFAQYNALQELKVGHTLAKWLKYFSYAMDPENREQIFHLNMYGGSEHEAEPIFH